MNLKETINKLNDHGIYQLNKGETIGDAINHIDNGAPRVGYRFKSDQGRLLTDNEIIAAENKVSFLKTVSPKEFIPDEVESIDDILKSNDFRECDERGVIAHCYYCGDCIRIDAGPDDLDYEVKEPEIHCDDCLSNAIANLAM